MISNHDLKSIDLKSFPTLNIGYIAQHFHDHNIKERRNKINVMIIGRNKINVMIISLSLSESFTSSLVQWCLRYFCVFVKRSVFKKFVIFFQFFLGSTGLRTGLIGLYLSQTCNRLSFDIYYVGRPTGRLK